MLSKTGMRRSQQRNSIERFRMLEWDVGLQSEGTMLGTYRKLVFNVRDFLKNPRAWLTATKLYVMTKFMSQKEKNNILIQAKDRAEAILAKNGLNVPFKVYLEDEIDIYFRTLAMYEIQSSEKGVVKIFVKSHLIGKDIDMVVHNILHEYSHAIFEEGFSTNLELGFEIVKLKTHIIPHSPEKREKIRLKYEKEYFCDCFASYLLNKEQYHEETAKICENIIQMYVQIHTNRT